MSTSETTHKPLVLLVDDELGAITLLKIMFEREGYSTVGARSGTEALEFVQHTRPDLILLDIMMPGLTGWEVLQQFRNDARHTSVPVIMVTARFDSESIIRSLGLGAVDFIAKPLRADEIIFRSEIAIARSKLISALTPAAPDYHVFISYSSHDRAIMQRLMDDLVTAKLKIWVDQNSLEIGTPAWENMIAQGIRNSGCVLSIMSPDAERSLWVGRELALAETLGKRIFPVLARGDERSAIPLRLMSHQWLDARQNYQDALERLMAGISKYLNLD